MKCKFCNSNIISTHLLYCTIAGAYNYYCNSCDIYYWANNCIINDCVIDDYTIFFKEDYL